jgi:hypothetical protein
MTRLILKAPDGEVVVTLADITERVATFAESYPAPADVSFVFNQWLTSYRVGDEPRKMGNGVYFKHHHDVVRDLVRKPTTRVLVAELEAEPGVYIGFGCAEPSERVLHFAATKQGWRNLGLFRGLVGAFAAQGAWQDDAEVMITHHTYFVDKMRDRSPMWRRRLVYNPYLRRAA